jgi:hypothetical protein
VQAEGINLSDQGIQAYNEVAAACQKKKVVELGLLEGGKLAVPCEKIPPRLPMLTIQ